MNGKVIGSELKWNRLFRLRCMLPCDVQWMRKYCKAESAASGGGGVASGVYVRCGDCRIEGNTVKHQQRFGCNLCYFIHLSLKPFVYSDFQSSVESSAKCQELELKSCVSHSSKHIKVGYLVVSVTLSRWVGCHKRESKQTTWRLSAKVSHRCASRKSFACELKFICLLAADFANSFILMLTF